MGWVSVVQLKATGSHLSLHALSLLQRERKYTLENHGPVRKSVRKNFVQDLGFGKVIQGRSKVHSRLDTANPI